jgi:hypothetical protein
VIPASDYFNKELLGGNFCDNSSGGGASAGSRLALSVEDESRPEERLWILAFNFLAGKA